MFRGRGAAKMALKANVAALLLCFAGAVLFAAVAAGSRADLAEDASLADGTDRAEGGSSQPHRLPDLQLPRKLQEALAT